MWLFIPRTRQRQAISCSSLLEKCSWLSRIRRLLSCFKKPSNCDYLVTIRPLYLRRSHTLSLSSLKFLRMWIWLVQWRYKRSRGLVVVNMCVLYWCICSLPFLVCQESTGAIHIDRHSSSTHGAWDLLQQGGICGSHLGVSWHWRSPVQSIARKIRERVQITQQIMPSPGHDTTHWIR